MRRILLFSTLLVALLVASGPIAARSMEHSSGTSTSAVTYLVGGRDQRNVIYEAFLDPACGHSIASATPIENAAADYVKDGQPVLFIEYAYENWPFSNTPRQSLWYQSYKHWTGGSTTFYKPPTMTDSGYNTDDGAVDATSITTMVDDSLARAPRADIQAAVQRVGNHYHFDVDVTNLSGETLSTANEATVWAIVYEDVDPSSSSALTSRYVRAVVSTPIPSLANGATSTYSLDTPDLVGVDWYELHPVVIVDYRPAGAGTGYYDTLQTAFEPLPRTIFTIAKFAEPITATVGSQITYTIQIQNTSDEDGDFTMKDNLPPQVTYPGSTERIGSGFTPGTIWNMTFVVTVTDSFTPAITNQVVLTPTDWVPTVAYATVYAPGTQHVFLPLTVRNARAVPSTPWQTILEEDFEGAFPGSWTVTDTVSSGYQWAKRDCQAHSGTSSGWAIGGGTSGSGLSCGTYTATHDLGTRMIYGPLDLSDATEAEISFWYWFDTDVTGGSWSNIQFCAGAETNPNGPFDPLTCIYGDSGGWREATFDLSWFDVLGESAAYVQINFDQGYPSLALEGGGVFVDDVVVRKR